MAPNATPGGRATPGGGGTPGGATPGRGGTSGGGSASGDGSTSTGQNTSGGNASGKQNTAAGGDTAEQGTSSGRKPPVGGGAPPVGTEPPHPTPVETPDPAPNPPDYGHRTGYLPGAVRTVSVWLQTADETSAGTSSRVYLGLAGREFRLSRGDGNNFYRGANVTFTLGEEGNINEPDGNDPGKPRRDVGDLMRFPVYIRLEPDSADPEPGWLVERARVTVNECFVFDDLSLRDVGEDRRIWLSDTTGKVLHLKIS